MLNTSNDLRLDKQPIPIPGVPVVPGLDSIPPRMNQTEIILLENAIYWWVYPVIILYEKDNYRLIVIRKRKVLFDKTYKTLSDAKTDFEMHFDNSECIKIKYKGKIDGEPQWNDSHLADKEWLDHIFKLLDKQKSRPVPVPRAKDLVDTKNKKEVDTMFKTWDDITPKKYPQDQGKKINKRGEISRTPVFSFQNGVIMPYFLDQLNKINEFLLELSVRDNIKVEDRKQLRSLHHKIAEKILMVIEYQPDKAGQNNLKLLEPIKKIDDKIAVFSPWKRSVKDLLPLIDQLIAELDTLIENPEVLKNGGKK